MTMTAIDPKQIADSVTRTVAAVRATLLLVGYDANGIRELITADIELCSAGVASPQPQHREEAKWRASEST
jgi:hypothetical protein